MSIPVDITFHPYWWHKNAGTCFNKEFFYNADYRVEADIKMRQVLFEKFGDLGIGENNPLQGGDYLLGTGIVIYYNTYLFENS